MKNKSTKNKPTKIKLIIYDCSECPKHRIEKTPKSGYAIDYYCQLTGNKVANYIE